MTTRLVLEGRFDCTHLLKSGRGVQTYAGVDLETGAEVVVKTVDSREVSPLVRMRVAHEAVVLDRLETPDFRPLVTIGTDGDLLYLVQPFVPGVTLQARLATGGPLAGNDAARVGTAVLRSLQVAHDGDVLHRDVKPANVIVNPTGSIQQAVLIDFGFARSAWLDPAVRDEPVGTARYLSPEASGALTGAVVDERADLYALGVLLFECLAGRPPFEGDTVGEVLRQHVSTPPPSLRELRSDVPRALEAVIQRLLRKDPRERYQTAEGVIADLETIAAALARGVDDPVVVVGLHDRRQALTEPSFVGRATELAKLSDFVEEARLGQSGLVAVEAESGGGKTRLLDELAQRSQDRAWILRGQGVDQAAQRPFQLLEQVAAEVLGASGELGLGGRLRERLGDRAGAVAAALPALAPVLAPDGDPGTADLGPEAYGETRTVEALITLIEALGQPSRPAVLVLDDCQWADRLSLTLLSRWSDQTSAVAGHVLVVVAFRSEEVVTDHPLRAVRAGARLRLGPFGFSEMLSLAESMAGPLPAKAVEVVTRLSEGSPFMASAVLRGLVESGALADTPDGWVVDQAKMVHAQTSRRAALFLLRRLELLPPAALSILTAGAVLGKEFDVALAVDLSAQDTALALAALQAAVDRRIVWIEDKTGRCSFRHDKLREALLARLADEDRRHLHTQAAERLEADDPDRVFDLAYHFDAGGQPERALPYALRAAELARSRYALDSAAAHYRMADKALKGADAATRARVAEGLGDVLSLQGQYDEATTHLLRAHGLVDAGAPQAALEGKLGDVAFRKGDHADARRHLEEGLRQLGRRVPRQTLGFLILLVKELLVQTAHTLFPRLFVARLPREGADNEFLALRIYSRLAYVYWFHAGRIPCAWAHLRELNVAERYPPGPELAQAYSEHAPVMTMIPWYRRGIAYAQRSLAIRRRLGDVWGQGQSLHFYGVVLYAASRYRQVIDRCAEAVRLLDRTGDRWEVNIATWHIAAAHYRLGELGEAVDMSRRLHAAATEIGDQATAGISLSVWARASEGRIPAELIATELAKGTEDAQASAEVRLAEAVRLLALGSAAEAVEVLKEAAEVVKNAGLRQEYVAPVLPWLATALRCRVEQDLGRGLQHRRRVRKELRRVAGVARRAVWMARSYRNNLPHARREQAMVAALRGQERRARRLFAVSLGEASRQGASYEHALTRHAWGRMGEDLGWSAAGDMRLVAEGDLDTLTSRVRGTAEQPEVGEAESLSLADRFESLLSAGRHIASAPSRQAIYSAVTTAAVNLLRGEEAHVVPAADVSGPQKLDAAVSRSLMRRALEARIPVVASDSDDDRDASDSVVLKGLKSVLCAPILCDDKAVACLSVVHCQIGGLFSDAEIKLAEFITSLAGAALEAAEGTEARFRSLAQNSSDVITILDRRGRITYQSSSVERVFGMATDGLLGHTLDEWVHPDDLPNVLSVIGPALEGTIARPLLEFRLRHGDGSWHYTETALNALFHDPSVNGLVLNSRDVTERRGLEEQLRERALYDDLTELANRWLFADRLQQRLARRSKVPLAVLFLDLDDFKGVNDSLGHAAGDDLLRKMARRLVNVVRPADTVARLGGDEFAILINEANEQEARSLAERVMVAMAPSFELAGHKVKVNASVGVAVAGAGVSVDELLSRADAAMYAAKADGKGRLAVFDPSMRTAALERVGLHSDLQWAMQSDELEMHYQPVIHLETGAVQGFEAVVRWRHPVRGLLPPAAFIPVAEETGLIVPLGAWVLRQACMEGRRLQHSHPELGQLRMAVNVAGAQLQHPGLVREIISATEESGFDPHLLTLEVTESSMVEDTEGTIRKLFELKALGVQLAIDDFGTGYSSLSYLRRFPVDQLKIDRSFVSGLGRYLQDTSIVTSIIGLAHALGMEAVAEGVETMEQLERLTVMGCDLAQGFNWRRPAAVADVDAWLTASDPGAATHRVRTLLVDDRGELRAAVRLAMELDGTFAVVGEAADGEEAVAAAERYQPELIVLDLMMPSVNGLQALNRIRAAAPKAGVVLLTALDPAEVPAEEAAQTLGVLDKTLDLDGLVRELSLLCAV